MSQSTRSGPPRVQRALLLAAGVGSRLAPLTKTTPKCLVDINGKPLLDYWLDLLFAGGIARVLINVHWLSDQVVDHISKSPWRDRIDIVHEDELLGTGGTIAANRSWLGDEPCVVAHADNLTRFDLARFIAAHELRPPQCAMTMLAFHTDVPQSCGILELDDANVVQAFHEKVSNPPGTLANAAVYILEPEVADYAAGLGRAFVDLSTEVIPEFVGRIYAVEATDYHRDIGTPESLEKARREFLA